MYALLGVFLFGSIAITWPSYARSTDTEYIAHTKAVANACLDQQWERQACLSAVSYSTLALAANYAQRLSDQGHDFAVELIKEHCAAGTAAARDKFPAYALKSAWIECANTMSDIAETTGLKPNASHYQLLVGPILCLDKDRRCTNVERGLERYKSNY